MMLKFTVGLHDFMKIIPWENQGRRWLKNSGGDELMKKISADLGNSSRKNIFSSSPNFIYKIILKVQSQY